MGEKRILQSWKEIASYLGRAERTCRRWEKEFGLPVHRMDGSPSASVFAYKEELDRWLNRLLHEKKISSGKSLFLPHKKMVIFISISILFVSILTAVAWKILSPKTGVSSSSGKPSLAILYFSNNTGDESLDHWRSALAEWLITDLSQSKYLRVLSGDRLLNIHRELNLMEAKSYDSKDLENIAQEGAVNHILKASLSKSGDTFRIDYSLQDVNSWESVGSDYVTGKGEESFPSMVDELTKKIKADLNIFADQIAEDFDKDVGIITTGSAEAYKLYMEGKRYHNKTEYLKAIEIWEKAVALDPEFALAYRSMATAYKNMSNQYEYRELIKKALGLSNRISDLEKYRIQAHFYRSTEKTWEKAEEAFKTLLTHYPDFSPGNTNLGILYNNLEQWDKAIAQTDVNIRNNEKSFYSYNAQVYAYMAKGWYWRARAIIHYYLNNISNHPALRQKLAYYYLIREDYTKALNEVNNAIQSSSLWHYRYCKGNIYLCKGDFESAEIEYKRLLEMEEKTAHLAGWGCLGLVEISKGRFKEAEKNFRKSLEIAEENNQTDVEGWSRFVLAYLHLKKGNIAEALEDCETEWSKGVQDGSYSRQIAACFMKGLAHLQRDDVDEAEKAAKKLKLTVDQWLNKKMIRYHYLLIGLIELKKENFSASIENFRNALSQMRAQASIPSDNALFLELSAYAYYKLNDLDKAEKEFKKITSLTMGRLEWGDIYAKSFYMLGKIYEEKGWKGKAIEHYEKFLDLWKDADPGIPEIEDANRRLMALAS